MNKGMNGIKGQGMKSKISPVSPFNKKAQMQISFGMIFSVILIILFIAFAVYGISKFLGVSRLAQVESFKSDFQGDINKIWGGSGSSALVEYSIPNKIKQVCFVNDEYENMYFVPLDSAYKRALIKNIDIVKTTAGSTSNPKKLCIPTSDGKISMTIKNTYNEKPVTITK